MKLTNFFCADHKPIRMYLLTLLLFSFNFINAQPSSLNANSLKLKIAGNGYSDETYVYFTPQATTGFDPSYDAYKFMGIMAAPQLYSIIECCKLSINALPEIYNAMTVQMGFRVGVNTSYTISVTGLQTFGSDTTIYLEDTKLSQLINLKADSVYTLLGETTDLEKRFKLHFFCPMKFDLRVFLEGTFNGVSMNTGLSSGDLIPLTQPYNNFPWNYQGSESVSAIPGNSIVDWILVELRDAPEAVSADGSTAIGQRACFLMNDGSVRGLDGLSLPLFSEVFQDSVFIVIHHRNHLGVMSAFPLLRTGDTYHYDYTIAEEKAHGFNALKNLGNNVFGLYSGDANGDNSIDIADKNSLWSLFAGRKGYWQADVNLDGQVNNQDKNDFIIKNSGVISQVP